MNEVEKGGLDLILVRIKTTDSPLSERIGTLVKNTITDQMIQKILSDNAAELLSDIDYSRTEVGEILTINDAFEAKPIRSKSVSYNYRGADVPKDIPILIETMKETIRKRQNAISLLSTGASFIPGVGVAVRCIKGILDGADLFYGVSSSVKEQKEVVSLAFYQGTEAKYSTIASIAT